jgi:hypothetical protein
MRYEGEALYCSSLDESTTTTLIIIINIIYCEAKATKDYVIAVGTSVLFINTGMKNYVFC